MMLEIECLWHTDETRQKEEAGMEYSSDELERRTMTFYNIDAISPNHWDKEHEFCYIHAAGDKWIAAYDYETTGKLIEEAKKKATL